VRHKPRDFSRLVTECRDFLSEAQLRAHFELYGGYVKALNEIEEGLRHASREETGYAFGAYSELRRREPVAYNGTVLHELYFENLGAGASELPAPFRQAEVEAFGSWQAARADLKAMAESAHGWVLVSYDANFGEVRHNLVHSEHHVGLLPNQMVLLAIDCWEHAYFLDYETRKGEYVDGVLSHLDSEIVARRLETARALAGEARAAGRG